MLIEPEAPPARLRRLANTAQFDCTHHPAMSLPCGMIDGLPVGMMLVAKAFDEETIYRAAAAFERGVDWKTIRGVRRRRGYRTRRHATAFSRRCTGAATCTGNEIRILSP